MADLRAPAKQKSPYQRYIDLRAERMQGRPIRPGDVQQAIHDCLLKYAQREIPTFPVEIAFDLAIAMRDALAGHDAELFRPKKLRRGESPNPPTVDDCIADGVRYIKFCRAGYVADSAPNKTVRNAYGVAQTTVRDWCKSEKYEHAQAPTARPDDEAVRRVVALMQFSARHYPVLQGAHSKQAIRRRATGK